MINTLKTFEIESFEGGNDRVGIWVDDKKKIGFLGVSFSRWVSMHGFSLNISNDLSIFDNIIPCGLNNIEITSMEKELQKQVMMEKVVNEIVKNFEIEFERKVEVEHEEEE
jgi:lipoyl(octanoyl) transferase